MKVNAGAGPASGSRGPRTPKQLGRSGVPVPVPPPPALQQGAPHDEHRHSPAAHKALHSQTRMLLSQVKRALSSHQLTGILQGQENLICKVPCSFMQLLYSLLSFFFPKRRLTTWFLKAQFIGQLQSYRSFWGAGWGIHIKDDVHMLFWCQRGRLAEISVDLLQSPEQGLNYALKLPL